jgi:hypothetical protein
VVDPVDRAPLEMAPETLPPEDQNEGT